MADDMKKVKFRGTDQFGRPDPGAYQTLMDDLKHPILSDESDHIVLSPNVSWTTEEWREIALRMQVNTDVVFTRLGPIGNPEKVGGSEALSLAKSKKYVTTLPKFVARDDGDFVKKFREERQAWQKERQANRPVETEIDRYADLVRLYAQRNLLRGSFYFKKKTGVSIRKIYERVQRSSPFLGTTLHGVYVNALKVWEKTIGAVLMIPFKIIGRALGAGDSDEGTAKSRTYKNPITGTETKIDGPEIELEANKFGDEMVNEGLATIVLGISFLICLATICLTTGLGELGYYLSFLMFVAIGQFFEPAAEAFQFYKEFKKEMDHIEKNISRVESLTDLPKSEVAEKNVYRPSAELGPQWMAFNQKGFGASDLFGKSASFSSHGHGGKTGVSADASAWQGNPNIFGSAPVPGQAPLSGVSMPALFSTGSSVPNNGLVEGCGVVAGERGANELDSNRIPLVL